MIYIRSNSYSQRVVLQIKELFYQKYKMVVCVTFSSKFFHLLVSSHGLHWVYLFLPSPIPALSPEADNCLRYSSGFSCRFVYPCQLLGMGGDDLNRKGESLWENRR